MPELSPLLLQTLDQPSGTESALGLLGTVFVLRYFFRALGRGSGPLARRRRERLHRS